MGIDFASFYLILELFRVILSKYMFTTKYSMFSWESETHNFYVLKFEPMIIFAHSEQAKLCTIDVALIKFNLYKCKQIKLY